MTQARSGVLIGRCFHDPELDQFLGQVARLNALSEVLAQTADQLDPLRADAPRYYLWLQQVSSFLTDQPGRSELNFWAEGVGKRPSSATLPEQLIAANVLHEVAWNYFANDVAGEPAKGRAGYDHTMLSVAALAQAATVQDPMNPAVLRMEMITRMEAREPDRFEWYAKACASYPTILPLLLTAMRGHLPEWGGEFDPMRTISLSLAENDPAGVGMVPYLWFLRQDLVYRERELPKGFFATIPSFLKLFSIMSNFLNEKLEFLESSAAAAIARTQAGHSGPYAPAIHQHWFQFWHTFQHEKAAAKHVPYLGNRYDESTDIPGGDNTLKQFKKVARKQHPG